MNTFVLCSKCFSMNRVAFEKADQTKPVCGSCKEPLPFSNSIQELSGTTLTKLLAKASRPVVVDFWAPWCGPCRSFAPTYTAAARELGDSFILTKLNTEAHPFAGESFSIKSIPTLVVFNKGVEVDRVSGALPLPSLMKFLSRWSQPKT